MPMIPLDDPTAGMQPEGPVPGDPMMAGDPMMDMPEPAPEEVAMALGAKLEEERMMGHAMVDQMADQRLQQVMGMIAGAGDQAQVMGPGSIA